MVYQDGYLSGEQRIIIFNPFSLIVKILFLNGQVNLPESPV